MHRTALQNAMAKDCPTHSIDGYRAATPVRRPRCVTRLVRPRPHDRVRRLVYDPRPPDRLRRRCGRGSAAAARRHGLGRARPSRPETWSDKSAIRRHPERLRHAGAARPGDRLGARGCCFGACDTPRVPSRDGPLWSQGSAGVRTAGLRVVPTAPTATAELADRTRAGHMCSVWRGAGEGFARLGVPVANTADLDTQPVH